MTTPVTATKAGPGLRFGARLIDGLVLFIPLLLVTVPLAGGFQVGSGNRGGKQIIASLIATLLAYGYFVLMESTQGATIGKRALKIEVWTAEGGKPSLERAAKRNAWMLLAVIPGAIGGLAEFALAIAIAVSIGNSPIGQGFHDKWAGLTLGRRADA